MASQGHNELTKLEMVMNTKGQCLLRQVHEQHFADDIVECIFVKEYLVILIEISLEFVPVDSIDNNPALVQAMAWCRTGD